MFSSSGHPSLFALRFALFVVVFIAIAEVWLRLITPACDPPFYVQDALTRVWRFEPSGANMGLYTVGRLPRKAGHWHINNAGYNSVVDYRVAGARDLPLIALFGDSYIEGLLSDVDQHVDAQLPDYVSGGCEAYAFGVSAASLAQCAAMSRYDAARYRPDVLVFLLSARAVTDSMQAYGTPTPYYFQIRRSGRDFVDVPPSAKYSVSQSARFARKSAIASYLRYNAHVGLPGQRIQEVAVPEAEAPGAGKGTPSVRELMPGARFLIQRLRRENPGAPMIFMYQAEAFIDLRRLARTPLTADGQAVRDACRGVSRCYFLDLRPVFARDWSQHHRQFTAVDGGHWNGYANRLVARVLAEFMSERHLLSSSSSRRR